MNGRVYDYNLGRFLSVDPVIQSPTNSQSINPYSYIMNNPLSGIDPTGYCSTGDTMKGCADGLENGETQAITNADGGTVGYVGKDNQGNIHMTNNGSSKGQAAVVGSMNSMDIGAQKKIAQNLDSVNSAAQGEAMPVAGAMSNGVNALNSQGSTNVPNSAVGSEAETGKKTSDIAKNAGKLLVKIGKGGNVILMALTPIKMGDSTLDLTKLRTADEQKQNLWFHYTDEEGFNAIVKEGYTIRPNKKGVVYLTKLEMAPAKAVERLFIGGWGKYANKGNYVIIFSATPGVSIKQVPGHYYEWIHQGKMKLGSEIQQINYAGQNPF